MTDMGLEISLIAPVPGLHKDGNFLCNRGEGRG